MPLALPGYRRMGRSSAGLAFNSGIGRAAEGNTAVFTATVLDPAQLQPAPIRPGWILEGKPEARCAHLSTGTRGWADTAHWSCTAGKFRWHYGWDETVLFLEGEVFITDEAGRTCHGVPGTSVLFPAGTSAVWEVPQYIRKIAFNHRVVPLPLHLAERVAHRLGRALGLH